jgi:hypothetical protein
MEKPMKMFALAIASMLLAGLSSPLWGSQDRVACSSDALPVAIQGQLKTDFASWKIQEAKDLSSSARKRWESMKVRECPGIAFGEFETANKAYAVLLVPVDHPDTAYRFVVFSANEGQPFHRLLVEKLEGAGAANYFIHRVPIADFFSEVWKRKLHVNAKGGILLVDAGTTEYETDVYFWSEGRYQHQPVDE